ncbi:hypothetical protein CHARACLAT_012486 [Characodon lateralis]|uniref:Uncharacterized protein n=1 Tax=Characodon lateralis TaxID=208331 RepID=A0ABU7D6U0_9TELE|nr:hypothetical protein [Characodon lateralis]
MSSRKLHPKSRNSSPPLRYPICIFTHSSCSSHSRGQTQTAGIQHLGQSLPFLNLVSVQLTSTDLNTSVGSQMVSSGVLPNSIAVNNQQDDQGLDSACTSGPIRWEEHRSGLIGTPLPSDSVSTPRDQERCSWFSGDSIQPDRPPLARVHSLESSHLKHEKTRLLPRRLGQDLPPFPELNQRDFSDGRGPPWEHGVRFKQLEFLAEDI